MSRCFKFSPVALERDGTNNDLSLTESIKLRQEWENARAKIKKEQKKLKKKLKQSETKDDKPNTTVKIKWRFQANSHEDMQSKGSGLSKEQDSHVASTKLGSSANIHTSNKRKEQSLNVTTTDSGHERKKIRIRFRLPSQRSQESHISDSKVHISSDRPSDEQCEAEVVPDQHETQVIEGDKRKQLLPPASRSNVSKDTISCPAAEANVTKQCELLDSTANDDNNSTARIGTEDQSKTDIGANDDSLRQPIARIDTEVPGTSPVPIEVSTESLSKVVINDETKSEDMMLYETLTRDWTPPPLQVEQNDLDQSWLFDTKTQGPSGSKKSQPAEVLCAGLWPHAHYIPEVDLYILPYTMPF